MWNAERCIRQCCAYALLALAAWRKSIERQKRAKKEMTINLR